MTLLLVRHARAGDRQAWEGNDRERPLDKRGRRQAEALVAELADYQVEAILTSPYIRCVETVEPLARARGLDPELRPELGEERQLTDGARLLRALADFDVVVCGHRGLEQALPSPPPRWRKGETLVLGPELEVQATLPPPA